MRIERGQIFVLSILAALVVTFVAGLWLPRARRIVELEQTIEAGERELAALRGADPTAPPAEVDAEAIEQEIALAVPNRPELGPLLERLSADLDATGLTVRELRAQAAVEHANVERIPIRLECSGNYAALRELIQRIESYGRLVRVDRLSVTGDAVATTGTLDAGMELSTFRRTAEGRMP